MRSPAPTLVLDSTYAYSVGTQGMNTIIVTSSISTPVLCTSFIHIAWYRLCLVDLDGQLAKMLLSPLFSTLATARLQVRQLTI